VIVQAESEVMLEHGVDELVLQYWFAKQFIIPQVQTEEFIIAPIVLLHGYIVMTLEHGVAELVSQYWFAMQLDFPQVHADIFFINPVVYKQKFGQIHVLLFVHNYV